MEQEKLEALGQIIVKELEKSRTISDSEHSDHHQWLRMDIARRKKCQERRQKIIDSVMGSLLISGAVGVLSGAWYLVRHFFKHTGGN